MDTVGQFSLEKEAAREEIICKLSDNSQSQQLENECESRKRESG